MKTKSKINGFAVAMTGIFISGVCCAKDLNFVGYDKDHNQRTLVVSEEDFSKSFKDVILRVNESAVKSLKTQEQQRAKAPAAESYWMLRNVIIGLGLNFSIGLGPLWNVSAAPRARLGFSNSTHPLMPD